jgi:hypothetical protein
MPVYWPGFRAPRGKNALESLGRDSKTSALDLARACICDLPLSVFVIPPMVGDRSASISSPEF